MVLADTRKTRSSMNNDVIITSYVITVDVMKGFGHESHVLAQVSDADVVFIAIMAALYFQNHHERALCVMQGRDTSQAN
jgi:hypothetical protein